MLLVRSPEIALLLYSLVLFPGVLLHEVSHWLAATFLGVRTGRFSVWPAHQPDGTLRLGYLETERTDFFREALVGAAPLVLGSLVVGLVGFFRLDLEPVGQALAAGDLGAAVQAAQQSLGRPDAWLWGYVVFAVSNSMLPSASDRRAWPAAVLALGLLGVLLAVAGFGPLAVKSLASLIEGAARAAAAVFSITISLDLIALPLLFVIEALAARATGLRVEY